MMVALQPSVSLTGLVFFLVTNEWIFEANFSFFLSPYSAGSSLALAGPALCTAGLPRQQPVPSPLGRFVFPFYPSSSWAAL